MKRYRKLIIILLALFIGTLIQSCSSSDKSDIKTDDPDRAFAIAKRNYDKKDYLEAIDDFSLIKIKLPILILSLVALSLCLYGAIEMRKRKKQGYILWLIGEILPIGTSLLFIGMLSMKGIGLIGIFIPLLFIILYTVNKKDLIY